MLNTLVSARALDSFSTIKACVEYGDLQLAPLQVLWAYRFRVAEE